MLGPIFFVKITHMMSIKFSLAVRTRSWEFNKTILLLHLRINCIYLFESSFLFLLLWQFLEQRHVFFSKVLLQFLEQREELLLKKFNTKLSKAISRTFLEMFHSFYAFFTISIASAAIWQI